jgi:hypothetical protein
VQPLGGQASRAAKQKKSAEREESEIRNMTSRVEINRPAV